MPKIGIGYITYKRPEHIKFCIEQVEKYTHGQDYKLYVHNDEINRGGIAYGKNMCLQNLSDCDYVFLFDDDCFPIKEGWVDYFINSGYEHALYMNDKYQPVYHGEKHVSYFLCSGVFMFMTRKAINAVGFFNSEYSLYGFEHAAYSHRINKAGLTPAKYLTLNDTKVYIYSLDLQGVGEYPLVHARSLTNDEVEQSKKINNIIYHKETTLSKLYYEFKNPI